MFSNCQEDKIRGCLSCNDAASSATNIASCWTGFSWMKVLAKDAKISSSGCCGIRRKKRWIVSRSGKWHFVTWTSAMEVSAKPCEYNIISFVLFVRELKPYIASHVKRIWRTSQDFRDKWPVFPYVASSLLVTRDWQSASQRRVASWLFGGRTDWTWQN